MIEKANKEFFIKEVWGFVGRTSKGHRKGFAALRSTSSSCVSTTKGKLEVVREHYEGLVIASLDDQFDDAGKSIIEKRQYSEMSSSQKDKVFG